MSDLLPEGSVCGDCAHWLRCKALISTLNPALNRCDFSPSRFTTRQAAPKGELVKALKWALNMLELSNESARGFNLHRHIGQQEAQTLEGADGRVKLLA